MDYAWINDDLKGHYSINTVTDDKTGDTKLCEVGNDGQFFAYFPNISNITDTWHGYPVKGREIGKNLAKYWLVNNIISQRDYIKIRKNKI